MRLIATEDDPSLDALASRVEVLEGRTNGARAVAPEAAPPAQGRPAAAQLPEAEPVAAVCAPAALGAPEPTLQRVRSLWQSIRTRAEGELKPLRAPLSRASVDAVDGDILTIRLVDASMESYVRDHAAIIERAIADVLGAPLRLNVSIDGSGRSPRARSAHRAAPPSEPEAEQADDGLGLLDYASKRIAPRRAVP